MSALKRAILRNVDPTARQLQMEFNKFVPKIEEAKQLKPGVVSAKIIALTNEFNDKMEGKEYEWAKKSLSNLTILVNKVREEVVVAKREKAKEMGSKSTNSQHAKDIMAGKKSSFEAKLGQVLGDSETFSELISTLQQRGTKLEFSTTEDEPNLDNALYAETTDLIKIDANLDENVMVDMLLWEGCNAENRAKFKAVSAIWNTKSPGEFGNAKAEVEADTSIKYALKIDQMRKEGAISDQKGTYTQSMKNQIATIERFDKDFFARTPEEQAEKAKEYIEFFKNSPQMKDAPRGAYTSLKSVEIRAYDKIKIQKISGLKGRISMILKSYTLAQGMNGQNDEMKNFVNGLDAQWPDDEALKPKAYSDILASFKATFPTIPVAAGYEFSPNMELVATIQSIVDKLEKRFLNTKPTGKSDKEWGEEKEQTKKDWTRRLGTITVPVTLNGLIATANTCPNAAALLTGAGV